MDARFTCGLFLIVVPAIVVAILAYGIFGSLLRGSRKK